MSRSIKRHISVIGLGYVGLPVAVSFGKKTEVIGYDINQNRINDLKNGYDATGEISSSELALSKVRLHQILMKYLKLTFILLRFRHQ